MDLEPINLKFTFSVQDETERVESTLKRSAHFKEKGYSPSLPKGISLENPADSEIESKVSAEFNSSIYKEKKIELENIWKEIKDSFIPNLQTLNLPIQHEYIVSLTKYGMGSYQIPNQVFINFEKSANLLRSLPHEIIHLTIENLILEHSIEHWGKERLVDLIQARFFPDNKRLQKDPENSDKIQEIFDKHFPDIKTIIEEIAKIKK